MAAGLAMPFVGLRVWAGTVDEAKILQSRILGRVVGYSLYLPPAIASTAAAIRSFTCCMAGRTGSPPTGSGWRESTSFWTA
ncbi:hypothetical protein ACFSYD_09705 [Paracoccus aerius]